MRGTSHDQLFHGIGSGGSSSGGGLIKRVRGYSCTESRDERSASTVTNDVRAFSTNAMRTLSRCPGETMPCGTDAQCLNRSVAKPRLMGNTIRICSMSHSVRASRGRRPVQRRHTESIAGCFIRASPLRRFSMPAINLVAIFSRIDGTADLLHVRPCAWASDRKSVVLTSGCR